MPGNVAKRLQTLARERCIPLFAMLELTARCNHACAFCFKARTDAEKELSTEEVLTLLAELAELGTLYLHLTGGEPLLRPDFRAIAVEARRRGFVLTLSSNGSQIDEETARFLASLPVATVQLSLHASTANLHDRLVGAPGSFDQVLAATAHLRAAGLAPLLTCTVGPDNLGERQALSALAREQGVSIRFDPRTLPPRRFPGPAPFAGPDRRVLEEVLTSPEVRADFLAEPDKVPRTPGRPICAAGRTRLRIDEQGTVYPCASLAMPLGTIRDGGLVRLWRTSPPLLRLRALRFDDGACVGCSHLDTCAPCIGRHYDDTGSILTPSPTLCWEARLRRKTRDA